MLKRAAFTVICFSLLMYVVPLTAQVPGAPATLVMRSGDRINGDLIDLSARQGYLIRVNGEERWIQPGDIAVIELAGSRTPSSDVRSGLASGQQYVVLRNGQVVQGRLADIGGDRPKILHVDTPSGQREFTSDEVAQVFLAPVPENRQSVATSGGANGGIVVRANQAWTATDITVRAGERLFLRTDGEIRLGPNERTTAAGIRGGQRGADMPLRNAPAGALIGRIDDGLPFLIGNQTAVRMPASGRLHLGINDDNVSDNDGQFEVNIAPVRR
jgi:hypothetical protein